MEVLPLGIKEDRGLFSIDPRKGGAVLWLVLGGIWVRGLGPDGVTAPWPSNRRSKGETSIVWCLCPNKAFCLIIELGLGTYGGAWPCYIAPINLSLQFFIMFWFWFWFCPWEIVLASCASMIVRKSTGTTMIITIIFRTFILFWM